MPNSKITEFDIDDFLNDEKKEDKKIATKKASPTDPIIDIDITDFEEPDPNKPKDISICGLSWCEKETKKGKWFCSMEHEWDWFVIEDGRKYDQWPNLQDFDEFNKWLVDQGVMTTDPNKEENRVEWQNLVHSTIADWRELVNQQDKDGIKPTTTLKDFNEEWKKKRKASNSIGSSEASEPKDDDTVTQTHDPGDSRLDTTQSKETDSEEAIQTPAKPIQVHGPGFRDQLPELIPPYDGKEVPTTRAGSDQEQTTPDHLDENDPSRTVSLTADQLPKVEDKSEEYYPFMQEEREFDEIESKLIEHTKQKQTQDQAPESDADFVLADITTPILEQAETVAEQRTILDTKLMALRNTLGEEHFQDFLSEYYHLIKPGINTPKHPANRTPPDTFRKLFNLADLLVNHRAYLGLIAESIAHLTSKDITALPKEENAFIVGLMTKDNPKKHSLQERFLYAKGLNHRQVQACIREADGFRKGLPDLFQRTLHYALHDLILLQLNANPSLTDKDNL